MDVMDGVVDPETAEGRSRRLFLMVISQAMKDATYGIAPSGGYRGWRHSRFGPNDAARHEKRRAWAWLTGNSADFREVCDLAGIDPDVALRRIRAVLDRLAPEIRAYERKPIRQPRLMVG